MDTGILAIFILSALYPLFILVRGTLDSIKGSKVTPKVKKLREKRKKKEKLARKKKAQEAFDGMMKAK